MEILVTYSKGFPLQDNNVALLDLPLILNDQRFKRELGELKRTVIIKWLVLTFATLLPRKEAPHFC